MNNLYLVLSVYQINKLVRVARANRKANRGKVFHTIILNDICTSADDGHPDQINSTSFSKAVDAVAAETKLTLKTRITNL